MYYGKAVLLCQSHYLELHQILFFFHIVIKRRCGKILCIVSERVQFDVSDIGKNIFSNKLRNIAFLVFKSTGPKSNSDLFIRRVDGPIYSLKLVLGYRTLVHRRYEWT